MLELIVVVVFAVLGALLGFLDHKHEYISKFLKNIRNYLIGGKE